MPTVNTPTTRKGVSLKRTCREVAEKQHALSRLMVAATDGSTGLVGYRKMIRCGTANGLTPKQAKNLARFARKIASYERPWWCSNGQLYATGTLCDGRAYPV